MSQSIDSGRLTLILNELRRGRSLTVVTMSCEDRRTVTVAMQRSAMNSNR